MENDNEEKTIPNESNLLESQLVADPNNQEKPIDSFDEVPIGGGNKFQMSEFPEEGDGSKVAPKKPLAKKPVLKSRQPVKPAEQAPVEGGQKLASTPIDQQPLPKNPKPLDEQPLPTNPKPLDEIPVGSNTANNQLPVGQFDQKPIGKSTFVMSEFPEGQQQPAQEKQYPMIQKLKSKAAKLRLSGMEDLLKLLEENPDDPDIKEVDIKALVKETTPANLEKGLLCLKLWVEKGKTWGDNQIKNAIQNGMAKVNTKKITIQICDLMYEESSSSIQTSILLGFKGKIAKLIAYYMMIVSELLQIYGIKKMKYLKPYISEIVKLLNDKKDLAIKSQGQKIIKEAYKWLGKDVVLPMLGDLKEGIRKELDSFWETYDKDIVMKAPKGEEVAQGDSKGKKKKVDAYDLSEPVDIFKKFNEKWVDSVLNAPKWSEKTKMLEEFVKAASVPKLANAQYRHISEMIRRLINDSNFNVVLWDMKVLAAMSRGLRRHFYACVKNNFSNVMWKFRDKKTQMVDETFNTLNDFLHSISIEQVLEDVKEGLQDKAPNMKCNLINWIGKFVETKGQEQGQLPEKASDAIKALFPIFQKLLNDGTAEVRDVMARNVFKMKMIIGDDFFEPLENKMSKTLASKAQSKVKANTKAKDKSVEKDMSKSTVSLKGKKQEEKNPSLAKTMVAPNKKDKKPQQPQLKIQKFEQPTFEDACDRIVANGFPEDQVKNIKANGPKERTACFNIIKEQSENMMEMCIVIRALYKDWKEINLVMNKELIAFIEERADYIEKPEMSVLIPYFIEKIGQTKFAEPLYKSLERICERIPGVFLVGQFIEKIKAYENKKPKMNSDVCICISKIITFVSAANVPVRQTILFADSCYKIQFSKKGALELLKTLYSYIGDQVKIYLESDTYSSLEAQFKKTGMLSEQEKKPKIQMVGQAGQKQKKSVNLLGDKPKVDITQQIQRLLPKMNDSTNWQNRRDSGESMINLINQNFGRVAINCMSDLMNGLKIRINDPNKQLIRVFMQLTGLLFPILSDKQLKVYGKMFTGAVADGLSDKMQANKKQASATLNKIGECIGQEHLLFLLAPYLEGDKQSRGQVIHIMLANEDSLMRTDTRDFPKGITNCLCDKNRQIRSLGQKLFEKVYEKIGIEVFRNIAKNQRPAISKDLNSIYDKYQKGVDSQTFISKANSPGKQKSVIRNPPSAKKRSLSKSNIKTQQRSYVEIEDQVQGNNISRIQAPATLIQGDQYFAPLKYLTSFRVERQENENWRLDEIRDQDEDFLRQQLETLIRKDISKKMLSFNHRRVSDVVLVLIKLCKDVTYQGHFRQIYDLLLKWSLLRLWGGNPALLSIVEIFPPIMSILEKKKLALNDFEVELIVTIVRQYFISSFLHEFKVSDSLHIILKSLISLSSGERVARKILRQFSLELTSIHRHLKKDVNIFYRDGLSSLTKMHLMDYIGNEDMLEEISRIKQLRSDPEFVDLLYKKFHEAVLNDYGFKKYLAASNSHVQNTPPPLPPHHPNNHQPQQQVTPVSQTGLPRRQRSKSNQSRNNAQKNNDSKPVAKSRVSTNEQAKSRPQSGSQRVSGNQPTQSVSSSGIQDPFKSYPESKMARTDYENHSSGNHSDEIDVSIYPAPHPISPLGKHLSKLFPPNEQTVTFFTQLFSEQGQKIANELISHSKIIFGSILKSVMQMLQNRQDYSPQKIVTQINLLQQCIKCKFVISNVDELLYTGTNFALKQLVYEDQNKSLIHDDLQSRGIDYKIENFIKVINGVMLRILENGNPQQVVNTLLQIHNEFIKAPQKSIKTTYLIMKCTSRVASNYTVSMNPELSLDFFIATNQYFALEPPAVMLQQFELPVKEKPKPDENFINSIKTIIFELCRILNTDIWDLYDRAMSMSKYQDTLIASYIQSLGIKYQEKQSNVHSRGQSGSKQNQELRKISELLSKNKTFETGILSLKKFTKTNQSFNPIEYFTSLGYDQKFIAMVMNGLQGKQRRTPRKDNRDDKSNKSKSPIGSNAGTNQQENIQDKIKKLKQKFQELQPPTQEKPKQNYQQNIPTNPLQSKLSAANPKEQRTVEIKRRIDEMKNRLNSNMDKQPR